jgi:cardiolipin synthase
VGAHHSLVELLSSAQRSIQIEMFLIGRDATGRSLIEILERKARAGVEVRLLVDAFGAFHTRGSFLDGLRAAGGRWPPPCLPIHRRWSFNLRSHRKLVLVDGAAA